MMSSTRYSDLQWRWEQRLAPNGCLLIPHPAFKASQVSAAQSHCLSPDLVWEEEEREMLGRGAGEYGVL